MKHEEEIKERLVKNAIHLIAEGGFEMATTKRLTYGDGESSDFRMNEMYIYRLFGSKESLYEYTFFCLDTEFYDVLRDSIKAIEDLDDQVKKRLYEVFLKVWHFILGNEEHCRCYVRYYYSVYFTKMSMDAHKKLYASIFESFAPLFKEEADVFSIMHSVFTSLFDFAIRVHNGDLADDEENRPHIFNVLYCMMMTYFNNGLSKESDTAHVV